MKYFLVFQNKTYKEEMSGGYLWAPKRNIKGQTFFHWENMTKIRKNNIIFSSVNRKIISVNIAKTDCFDAPRPVAFDKLQMWESDGWMVKAKYYSLKHPIDIDVNIKKILFMLPDKYAPFNSSGRGSQGYLFEISQKLSDFFLLLGKTSIPGISNKHISSGQGDGSMARETNDQISYAIGFSEWLIKSQKYQEHIMKYQMELLNITSEHLTNKLKYLKPIESINTVKELDKVIERLKGDNNFRINNILNKNGQIKALELYRKYLHAIQTGQTPPPSISTVNELKKDDIATIFPEEKYAPFVSALGSQGLKTIPQLRNISIYSFLNENNIYYGGNRYEMMTEITSRLELKQPITSEISHLDSKHNSVQKENNTLISPNENRYTDLLRKVELYLITQGNQPVTVESIRNDLDLGKRNAIGRLIREVPWAIEIEPNTYIHRDSIIEIDDAAEKMLISLKKLFSRNSGYASIKQFYDSVRFELEFFMFDNDLNSPEQLFAIATHLFSKEKYKGNSFIFYNGMHIWERDPDYPKSYAGLIVKWAREQSNIIGKDVCIEELDRIGAANPSTAFYIAIKENREIFWQYAPFQFILKEAVAVTDYWQETLKTSLETLLSNDAFVVPRSIEDYVYNSLPALPHNVTWTPLLIQDVIRDLDLGFRTVPAGEGQDSDVVHAAIVKNDSQIKTFGDIVWHFVDEEFGVPKEMIAEELRQFLLNKQVLKGNERLGGMHKAIPNDPRFIWLDDNNRVLVCRA